MTITNLKENLTKKGYIVSEFDTKEKAVTYLEQTVKDSSIGFGGSMTLKELDLFNVLSKNNKVYWHWEAEKLGITADEARRIAMTTDLYFTSANAISEEGEIVNIDGTGNRVAAMTYGHKKVYIIIGENKLASSLQDAIDRARNEAAPPNARRLNRKTPCAIHCDKCYDCDSPDRICNILSVFYKKPGGEDVEVILIHEKLGY